MNAFSANEVICGDQPTEKSLFYPFQTSRVLADFHRRIEDVIGLRWTATKNHEAQATVGDSSDCAFLDMHTEP